MRLNKFIASSGICSRRKADELIFDGKVKVNKNIVVEPFYDVLDEDEVFVNNKKISLEKNKIYIMLNKPRGYLTSVPKFIDKRKTSPFETPTIYEFLKDRTERIFPVGRLDKDTRGLIFLTNDGEWTYSITHPKNEKTKTYEVLVNANLTVNEIKKLERGVFIFDTNKNIKYKTKPAEVKTLKQFKTSMLLQMRIHEGKNRQIRKMIESLGKKVVDLKRVSIGNISLGRLKEGQYRKLSEKEIKNI